MALSIIEQGKRLFNKKKYTEVISCLEPHVLDYRDSFTFHFYLGLAFLNIGEIPSAMDYFSSARKLKETDPDLLSVYAVMCLRRSDTLNAVEYYLRALEHEPNYKLAKKGLQIIRRNNSPEAIGNLIQSGKIKNLYPRPGLQEKRAKLVSILLVFLIAFVTSATIIPYIYKNRMLPVRADVKNLELSKSEKKHAVDMEGTYLYVLTEDEILKTYQKAHSYFQAKRDNASQVEINRVLSSNASFSIKQKARLLVDYLEEPSFDSIKDKYTFSQVKSEPMLYLDCWVVWYGMPTNIITGSYSTSFDLMVGYDTKNSLEGIVPVACKFVSKIDPEEPVTVLGRVKLKDTHLYLEVKGIHQKQRPIDND